MHTRVLGILKKRIPLWGAGRQQNVYLSPIHLSNSYWVAHLHLDLRTLENKGQEGRGDAVRAGPSYPRDGSQGRRQQRAPGVAAMKLGFLKAG